MTTVQVMVNNLPDRRELAEFHSKPTHWMQAGEASRIVNKLLILRHPQKSTIEGLFRTHQRRTMQKRVQMNQSKGQQRWCRFVAAPPTIGNGSTHLIQHVPFWVQRSESVESSA